MVEKIEQYGDVLKVILKSTKKFSEGYFYTDNNEITRALIQSYTWHLEQYGNDIYVRAETFGQVKILFHQELAYRVLGYYPDCIDHVNRVGLDNRDNNLNVITRQQNRRNTPSLGYKYVYARCFIPAYQLNKKQYYSGSYCTEPKALLATYYLHKELYSDYNYNFYLDRRDDLDILDLERTGVISQEEATYRHVRRYVDDNPWYVYRYGLEEYCKDNHIVIPNFTLDEQGFMIHPITGQRFCPYI